MGLKDRVVYTNASSIRGYVRKVSDVCYFWTLKDFEPNGQKDVSPFIMAYGQQPTPREAFQALYSEIMYYTLDVVKGSEQEKK